MTNRGPAIGVRLPGQMREFHECALTLRHCREKRAGKPNCPPSSLVLSCRRDASDGMNRDLPCRPCRCKLPLPAAAARTVVSGQSPDRLHLTVCTAVRALSVRAETPNPRCGSCAVGRLQLRAAGAIDLTSARTVFCCSSEVASRLCGKFPRRDQIAISPSIL